MANRLAGETSPYLLAHADNPVDWYPWGDEAFAQARESGRPILLSVGYNACHWCHVMAHESFEDPATAEMMNRLYVNIKVDREERPDVDGIYMQAVQALSGHGGWPMTVFLTPDGTPYFGGTYFPPVPQHGMPDFRAVLQAASDAFHQRRDEVDAAGKQLRAVMEPPSLRPDVTFEAGQLETATERLLDSVDWDDGGFGRAPKFPHPAAIDFLLCRFARTSDPRAFDAAAVCLDRMARGGIFDQVGGGFHRYSVDGIWAVPHFEKMLYDNAQLAPVYVHAWQLSGRERWRAVAEATLDYLVREMRLPGGAFAASQDADTEAGEGSFFVWTPAGIREVLSGDDGVFAAAFFGVTENGNFEDGATVLSIPEPLDTVAARLDMPVDAVSDRVRSIRARLYAARSARPSPARDDKVLTSWNALTISAFAEAGAVLGRDDYVGIARTAADFVLEHLCPEGRVLRTWKDGIAKIDGFLEDVTYLAGALLTLYEATGEPRYYERAVELAEDAATRYAGADGGLYDTAEDNGLLVRPRTLDDNPLPAGQSVAAMVFLRLYGFTGERSWRERAMAIIEPMSPLFARSPLAVANLGIAAEMARAPLREIAVAGGRDDPRTVELVRAAWRRFDPGRVLAWGDPAAVPLLRERPLVDGAPAAYVCENFVCTLPVTSPPELATALAVR